MTTITVLAGERSIGGTQIVVEDHGARLLFDCGLAYDPARDPAAPALGRADGALSHVLAQDLAPYVPGLYDPRRLHSATLRPALPPHGGPIAVALSHAHLDHSHLAGFVDPAVPVHCSSATARIVTLLGALGRSLGPDERTYTTHEPGASFMVGSMRVELLSVDHDVGGACGLLIHTSSGVIAYSGDLRLHGSHPERSLAFARAARETHARLLILEGTRLWPEPQEREAIELSEDEVAQTVAAALAGQADRLGLILLTPENGERIEALARAMHSIDRLLVLDAEGLALAMAALGRPLAPPHAVYVPDQPPADGAGAERLRAAAALAPRRLGSKEIAADRGRFLLRLRWPYPADLRALPLDTLPAVLFQADGVPLGPFDPAWQDLERWALRLSMPRLQVGSSGHATPGDLTRIAHESGVPVVMCVHSYHPELLRTGGARLLLPQRGRRYVLDQIDVGQPAAL